MEQNVYMGLVDRQLTYGMQYSHLRVSFLNGIRYWSIDDDDDDDAAPVPVSCYSFSFRALWVLLLSFSFFFFLSKILLKLVEIFLFSLSVSVCVWRAGAGEYLKTWEGAIFFLIYWSIVFVGWRLSLLHYRQNRASFTPGATSQLITMATMVPAWPPLPMFLPAKGFTSSSSSFLSFFFPSLLFPEIYDEGICICAHDADINLYISIYPFSSSAAATPGRPDCWTWRKSRGSRMTRSILNILTGGLPFWTTLRPLLFLMWPSSVAFSFRDGARKVSTGRFSSSFTGKTQSVNAKE